MTIFRSDDGRNAMMVALAAQRGSLAQVQVRSGPNAGTGGQGTLIAQMTGHASGWGTSVTGVLTSFAIALDSSADAPGLAAHYQLNTSAAVFLQSGLLDGSDGPTIDNPSIVAGQVVQMLGLWVETAPYDDGV